MKEITIDHLANGLELVIQKPIVKYTLYAITGVLALYLIGTVILPVLTTFVVSYKGLKGALNKPV